MMSRPGTPRIGFRRLLRAGVVALLLLSNLLAATGVPLPAVVKDTSEPFPCMDHECGCLNAAQCWRGCCCMTMTEKLAWAAEHAVAAPASAREAAAREQAATPAGGCEHCRKDRAAHSESTDTVWVLGIQAQKCQNHGPMASIATALALPPLSATLPEASPTRTESITLIHEHGRALSHRPAVPPPRLVGNS